jgi:DNA-binding GntR family transcriptional regulator
MIESTRAYEGVANVDDQVTIAAAHINFHKAFVGLTGSMKLACLEESLMQDLQVIIACIENDRDDLQKEIANHKALTQMVLDGDIGSAEKWVDEYIPIGKEFVIEHILAEKKNPRLGR